MDTDLEEGEIEDGEIEDDNPIDNLIDKPPPTNIDGLFLTNY